MKMSAFRSLAVLSAASLLLGCAATPPPPVPQSADTQVRLLATSDIHGYVLGYDYYAQQAVTGYGLAHTANLIEGARREADNVLLIDSGDLIQGSALGDWAAKQGAEYFADTVHPVIAALNALEYDAAVPGNHEFDFGLDFFHATLSGAEFPYVTANIFTRQPDAERWSSPLLDPYVILPRTVIDIEGEEHSLNVGIIGFTPPQIMEWNRHYLEGEVVVEDMVAAARHYIPQMREAGADIVIAVPHAGLTQFESYPQFAEQATSELARVNGIDAILFGHQHRLFPGDPSYDDIPGVDNERGRIRGIPAVQPGQWGAHLGVIDLTLRKIGDEWRVTGSRTSLRSLTAVPLVTEHPDVVAAVGDAHTQTLEMLNEPLLPIASALRNYFAQVRPELTVQLINEAQLSHGKALQELGLVDDDVPLLSAASPFRNGATGPQDYTSIPVGELTLGNLADIYVYPNTLQVVRINGAQLRDWLEMSARIYQQIEMQPAEDEWLLRGDVASFNFDVIRGVTYEIQPHHPARFDSSGQLISPRNHRIYNLRYDGRLISAADEFLVVTNNYRASGGGNFPHLDGSQVVYDGAQKVRDILVEHLIKLGEQYPNGYRPEFEEHWHLALPRGARVLLRSSASPAALDEARRQRDVEFLRLDNEGYGIYRILP